MRRSAKVRCLFGAAWQPRCPETQPESDRTRPYSESPIVPADCQVARNSELPALLPGQSALAARLLLTAPSPGTDHSIVHAAVPMCWRQQILLTVEPLACGPAAAFFRPRPGPGTPGLRLTVTVPAIIMAPAGGTAHSAACQCAAQWHIAARARPRGAAAGVPSPARLTVRSQWPGYWLFSR
eukprot:395696-Hanusia_phi.AAC.1